MKYKLDKIWVETLERITALERVVDALAARIAKLDQKTKPKSKSKK